MKFISCFVFSILTIGLYSQASFCGTGVQDQSALISKRNDIKSFYHPDQGIIYIPLQIHNVGNDNSVGFFSNLTIFESICTLNQDFLPSGIQFYMENEINYIRNTSWNDHTEYDKGEEMMRKSNFPNIVNCYLVANPAGNCGYYTYRGDAVALSKNCVGKNSHTWAHELGHYFSLPHTFYGWEGIRYSNGKNTEDYQSQVSTSIENVERDNCRFQADNFCDTPPDYISNRWNCANDGFSGSILKDTKDSLFRVDGTLFMSYANDECMNRFSVDQTSAMLNFYNGPRANLKRPQVVPKFVDPNPIELSYPLDSIVVPANKILLSWKPVANASYYSLQISRTENFTVVVKNIMLSQPYVEIDSLISDKNYWWKVRAFSNYDFCGSQSEVGLFRTERKVVSDENLDAQPFYITPNPVVANQAFVLHGLSYSGTDQFMLHSVFGTSYRIQPSQRYNDHILFETESLPGGVYFLTSPTNKSIKPIKLILKSY